MRAAKVENSLVIVVVWMLSFMGAVQSIIYDQRLSTEVPLDLFSAVANDFFAPQASGMERYRSHPGGAQ